MELKIKNFWDKWSDEEKEAVEEYATTVAAAAAKMAMEKLMLSMGVSENQPDATDSK